jgi:hypothetical protein
MKKTLLLLAGCFLLFVGSKAQKNTETNKWFFSFSTGFCIGGANTSIENAMNDQYYNNSAQSWFGGSVTYPITSVKPPVLFMAGVRVTKYGSLYMVIGQTTGGKAEGYDGTSFVSFDYNVMQYTLGYQFSFPDTRFKLGIGPSLFTFKNTPQANFVQMSSTTSSVAGATINLRVPFGQEKKLFGIELFGQLNLAPGATTSEINFQGHTFRSTSVSMTNAVIGITFAFRG